MIYVLKQVPVFSNTTNKGVKYPPPPSVMDEVAHTSLSVHFLSKPAVLWVNKDVHVCYQLLTTNTFRFMQDIP